MNIFEASAAPRANPLLRDIITLITRDESRHMGFGILYVGEWMRQHSLDEQIAFARRWLGQISAAVTDQPGPSCSARLVRRLREAGVDDAEPSAPQMLREQQAINAADVGGRVRAAPAASPEERSARRPAQAGILAELGTRRAPADPGDAADAELSSGHIAPGEMRRRSTVDRPPGRPDRRSARRISADATSGLCFSGFLQRCGRPIGDADAVLLHLLMKEAARDAEHAGSLRHIPAVALQDPADMPRLEHAARIAQRLGRLGFVCNARRRHRCGG